MLIKRSILIFALCLIVTGLASAQASTGDTMYVAVKTLSLKSGTGFFAGKTGTLNYGDRVTVIQINGKKAEIQSASDSSVIGWADAADLTPRQIVQGNTTSASAREVALASKGFNQEVEDSYKTQGNLNYEDVDKVEAITVSEEELKQFLEEGHLSLGE